MTFLAKVKRGTPLIMTFSSLMIRGNTGYFRGVPVDLACWRWVFHKSITAFGSGASSGRSVHIVGGALRYSYPGVGRVVSRALRTSGLGVVAFCSMERREVQTNKGRARLTRVASFEEPAGSGEANVLDKRIKNMGMKKRCIMVQRARLD